MVAMLLHSARSECRRNGFIAAQVRWRNITAKTSLIRSMPVPLRDLIVVL